MRFPVIFGTSAALALLTASPAAAQTEPDRVVPIGSSDAFTVDEARAYLLIESNRPFSFNFVRLAEQGAAEGDVTAQAKFISIGPRSPFSSANRMYVWLAAVKPGEYVFYGTGGRGSNVCACMGTVGFRAEAGQVTALHVEGVLLDEAGAVTGRFGDADSETDRATRAGLAVMPVDHATMDARIPQDLLVTPSFTPVARVPNLIGGTVSRVVPMEGVFTYDRDMIVDLRPEPQAEPDPSVVEVAADEADALAGETL